MNSKRIAIAVIAALGVSAAASCRDYEERRAETQTGRSEEIATAPPAGETDVDRPEGIEGETDVETDGSMTATGTEQRTDRTRDERMDEPTDPEEQSTRDTTQEESTPPSPGT